jgi:hypothetical protein
VLDLEQAQGSWDWGWDSYEEARHISVLEICIAALTFIQDFLLGKKMEHLMPKMTWICHIKEVKKRSISSWSSKTVFDHEENFFSTFGFHHHHLKHPSHSPHGRTATTSLAPTKALQTTQHLPNNASPTALFAVEKPASPLVALINRHRLSSQRQSLYSLVWPAGCEIISS